MSGYNRDRGGGGGGGGGRGGGGGGGGYGRGGRDFGGRGGRGGGRNRHMGEISSIMALLSGQGMTDRDILSVINPPLDQQSRKGFLGPRNTPMYNENAITLPGHSKWRYSGIIGRRLNPANQIIRANHFKIDTSMITGRICHYHVHMYRYDREGVVATTDCAPDEDPRITSALIISLRKNHPEWDALGTSQLPVGITYDGRSALFSTIAFALPTVDPDGQPFLEEDVFILNRDESISKKRYKVTLTHIGTVFPPTSGPPSWGTVDQTIIRALDTSIFSFARWQQIQDDPEWFLVGSKAFRASGEEFRLAPGYVALRGYYAGLKTCMAGLVLVSDMSVSSFLAGGDMIQLMSNLGGFRNVDEFMREARQGLPRRALASINDGLKNCKCRLVHLGHWKKVKALGPAANSIDSSFDIGDGKSMTVEEYFTEIAREKRNYRDAMGSNGRLRYPFLPTVNVGSKNKPILVPPELVRVPGGQCRSNKMTGDMTAQMIRTAAVRPDERMQFITNNEGNGQSIVNVMRSDPTSQAFGLNLVNPVPMSCAATLLPPAKLQYGGAEAKVVDPKLSGTWNMEGVNFAKIPPGLTPNGYMYGVLLIGDRISSEDPHTARQFAENIERESKATGIVLKQGGAVLQSSTRLEELELNLGRMKRGGARIVLCMLLADCYSEVKLIADKLGLPTQCLKWKNIERSPRGFHYNVMLKINTKMGGTNHTLISRLSDPSRAPQTLFQDPPASISWIFDKPCMLMGIDVSHAEPGSDRESMAAVVGSMDGRACQYVAHISSQSPRVEIVGALAEAVRKILEAFKARNHGQIPSNIIVFRDGVSDGQFEQVVTMEVPAIKEGLALCGYPEDACNVAMVVCQKGHHTRIVYEEKTGSDISYLNPCPGILLDATGNLDSIASSKYNEFYLNSHSAIQGTSKPCKYSLVYDEIGFKMSELELLTYWTCYLYCRCNKSVSLATPAYYAHWASRRARYLSSAGATPDDLLMISDKWSEPNIHSTMFFV